MANELPVAPPGKPINTHIGTMESLGWGGYYLASGGISAAQVATSSSTVGICTAVAAGAAVSATGVGLVVAGGALTVGSAVVNARAAHSTRMHRKNLREIYANYSSYDCCGNGQIANMREHYFIADPLLPYVIKQKGKKFGRRVRYSIPGVNLFSSLRAVGTKGWKYFNKTLGKERMNAATWLVRHLFSHNCELVEAIIAELYSEQEMLWLKYHCDEEIAIPLIAHKLRSV